MHILFRQSKHNSHLHNTSARVVISRHHQSKAPQTIPRLINEDDQTENGESLRDNTTLDGHFIAIIRVVMMRGGL